MNTRVLKNRIDQEGLDQEVKRGKEIEVDLTPQEIKSILVAVGREVLVMIKEEETVEVIVEEEGTKVSLA